LPSAEVKTLTLRSNDINNNNNNTLIYIAPACRMTSEALKRLEALEMWMEKERKDQLDRTRDE